MIENQRAAIAEEDAAGDVAAAHADIRAVTGIPIVNLVWRQLAAEPGRLAQLWAAVRDVVAASQAPAVLVPVARDAVATRRVGAVRSPDPLVGATLAAFDRGNACNLLALVSLCAARRSTTRGDAGRVATDEAPLPALTSPILPRAKSIAAADHQAFDQLAAAARPAMAPLAAPSLLHHLAARPGLLSSLAAATTPALCESLAPPAGSVVARAERLAAELAPPAGTVDEPELRRRLEAFSDMIARTMVLSALLTRALENGDRTAAQR